MTTEPESERKLPSRPKPDTPSPPRESPEPDLPSTPSPPQRKRKLRLILPSPPPSPEGDTPLPSPGDKDEAEPERPRKRARTRIITTNPTKPYTPPTAYAKAMDRLMAVNQVREYQRAEILFRGARHPIHGGVFAARCREELKEVLRAGPSEAIMAKCYMMLARRELGLEGWRRVSYAEEAIYAWRMVIERKGSSKFPIAKARLGLALAQELLAHAEEAVAQEESSGFL